MIGQLYRHKKSGNVYKHLGEVTWEPDGSVITIYQLASSPTSIRWARWSHVFHDGRFELIND